MHRRHRRNPSAVTPRGTGFAISIVAVLMIGLALRQGSAESPAPAPPAGVPAPPAGESTAAMQRPTDEMLRAVESDGRRIASYHEAIVRARQRAHGRDRGLTDGARLVVVARGGTWHVVFLRQETSGGAAKGWMAAADAVFQPNAGDLSAFQAFEALRPAPADALAALRAIDAARSRAQAEPRAQGAEGSASFEEALFRDGHGPWTVYLQQVSDVHGAVRIGGDFVAVTGADGQQVSDIKPIHDRAVWVTVPLNPGGSTTLHSHPAGDLPTATDVEMVIEHPTLAPHLVLTPRWMFRIETGGRITWLGANAVPPVAPGGGR